MKAADLVLSCFLSVFQPRGSSSLSEWMAENIVIRPTEKASIIWLSDGICECGA